MNEYVNPSYLKITTAGSGFTSNPNNQAGDSTRFNFIGIHTDHGVIFKKRMRGGGFEPTNSFKTNP